MATNASAAGRAPAAHPVKSGSWWAMPLFTVIVLGGFGIYVTFRALEGFLFFQQFIGVSEGGALKNLWEVDGFLSPLYSPPIAEWFGFDKVLPTSIIILIFPLTFRMSCYYYRKAYYRAFFFDPVACAVPEKRKGYAGETVFPWVWVNLHRFTFFFAAAFIFILGYDAVHAVLANGTNHLFGSLLFVVNVLLLAAYTFGCHSWRHIIGGKINCFSCGNMGRYKAWTFTSMLNRNHMKWAWASLFSVSFADVYVWLLAQGIIPKWL